MATISQRISLEGSEDIRKQLLALGQAGEQAFKQIQAAASKPISDAAQLDKTKQALNDLVAATAKLAPQFQTVSAAADKAGSSLQQVAESSKFAAVGMIALGSAIGTGLVAAFTKVKSLVESFSISELTKGAVDTAKELSDQAGRINLPVDQWLQLRRAIEGSGVSADDTLKSLTRLGQVIQNATDGIAKFTETTVQTENGAVTIRKFNAVVNDTSTIAGKARAALIELGVSTQTIASGNKLAIMQEVAAAIDKIPNATQRAERGLRVFGDNWEGIIKTLIASKRALEATRDLTPEQVGQLKKLGDAWDTLESAIRAAKDQVGLLFAGPAIARAKWLTDLADGVRKLVLQFDKLSEAKRGAFLEGLSGGPAETAFKVLIAVGQQLAGLWNQVLVPAGQKLVEIVKSIAGSFKGVSGSQVAAFFITAAGAALALAIALKGIALVLSPIAALFSLAFSPLGIILIGLAALVVAFWDQFKAAATAALSLIPQEMQQMKQAFAQLLSGNFAGFWNGFSAAAISAFQKIKEAALATDIGQTLAGAFQAVVDAIGGVETAAIGAAAALTLVFGRRVTSLGLGAVLAIAQMTGALDLLRNVVGIVGPLITGLLVSVGALVSIFGGVPVAVGLAASALAGLILYLDPKAWDFYASAAKTAMDLIVAPIQSVIGWLQTLTGAVTTGAGVWDIFRNAALGALNPIQGALNALSRLINGIIGLIKSIPATPPTGGVGGPDAGAQPFASGGFVGGRGTGTSDSNLAWVSRGEHIMPARAVRQPGVLAFLEALRRSGGDLSRILNGMGRFALGGMVPRQMAIPAFANGGPVGSMSNVTIQFPGLPEISGLRASSEVVDQLRKASALSQVRSGGRKPSRYS